MHRAILAAGVLTATAGPLCSEPLPVEFVSIAANTGKSAGGHCGLRLADRIYHYGVENGALLIKRDPWEDFVRRYRMLDNRRIDLTRFDLDEGTAGRIKGRLDRRYLVQEKHLARIRVLELEVDWFAYLLGRSNAILQLPGVGYFNRESRQDSDIHRLQNRIAGQLGAGFLNSTLGEVEAELARHALEISRLSPDPLAIDHFPSPGELAADRLQDRLRLREAIRVLSEGRSLTADGIHTLETTQLTAAEGKALEHFSTHLEDSITRLLVSPRPDRGGALLLGTARYLVVRRSLAENRWVFLDVARENQEVLLEAEEVQRHRDLVLTLAAQAEEAWTIVRDSTFAEHDGLNQILYNRLETAATQFVEPVDALAHGRAFRVPGGRGGALLPVRRGEIETLSLDLASDRLRTHRNGALENLRAYQKEVATLYDYTLLRRNCATELIEAIKAASPDGSNPEEWFGDLPEGGLTFVPALMSEYFRESGNVVETRTLPSWRHEQIETLVAESDQPEPKIRRRESNTVTSTTYQGSVKDDAFLLFNDGPRWFRPVKGVVNLGYGLGTGGVGLVTLPFDRGDRAISGLRGAFYSLPELIGVSTRKGRFDMVPLAAEAIPEKRRSNEFPSSIANLSAKH